MDKNRKKELRQQYQNRHPDMGVACWQCGEELWAAITKDARADYNSTQFQLSLGSWPNREMQQRYKEKQSEFQWSLMKKLDYEDDGEDYSDELELLLLEFLEEHPEAKPMRPGRKWKQK